MTTLRLVLAVLVLWSISAYPQATEVHAKPLSDDDIKLLRQDVQAVKNDVITKTMQFSPKESAAFWPIYRQYSREQNALAAKRLDLIKEYAQNLDKMGDAKASSMTERLFQLEDDSQSLRKEYFPKFVAALGAARAAKLYQVDNRLTMMTNVQLASEIPLIP